MTEAHDSHGYSCFRASVADKAALCLFVADQCQYDPRYVWLLPEEQRHFILRAVIFDPFMDWLLHEGEVWCIQKNTKIVGVISWQIPKVDSIKIKWTQWIEAVFSGVWAIGFFETQRVLSYLSEFTIWADENAPPGAIKVYQMFVEVPESDENFIWEILMNRLITVANMSLLPIWIFQSSPSNTGILRKYRFESIENKPVKFPGSPPMFTMVRSAGSGFGAVSRTLQFTKETWFRIFAHFDYTTFLMFRLLSRHCYELVGSSDRINIKKEFADFSARTPTQPRRDKGYRLA